MARVVTCGCACHLRDEPLNLAQAEYAAKRRARTFPMLVAFEAEMARLDADRLQQDQQIAEGAA